MRTQPLREDKHCLNCGYEVPERFCSHCGQENTVQHETFGHLVKHFIADIFHYDSQLLITLKYLVIRPGFLTREYMAGRRVRYVNPIKLYVFISFVFFFTAFGFLSKDWNKKFFVVDSDRPRDKKPKELVVIAPGDTVTGYRYHAAPVVDTSYYLYGDSTDAHAKDTASKPHESTAHAEINNHPDTPATTHKPAEAAEEHGHGELDISLEGTKTKEYDDYQAQLPPDKRDSKVYANLKRRMLFFTDYIGGRLPNAPAVKAVMWEYFQHNAPKIMFLLLPLAALLMKWMYRKQKKWVYADFAIFALHFHSFVFILYLLAVLIMSVFPSAKALSWANWVTFGYLVIALYNNYGQSWLRTIWKASLLWISYVIMVFMVMVFVMAVLIGLIL